MNNIKPARTATDILCRLVSIPSVNPMGRMVSGPMYGERRLSDWLVSFFQSIGVRHERIEVSPGRDNVIARVDARDGGAANRSAPLTLLLDAHQDTVPVDGMTVPPFDPQVRDGRVTGRGAADVKGPLAAMLFALRRLAVERPAGAADVVLSCTCDEEAGTIGVNDLVDYWRKPGRSMLLTAPPDGAIVAEPTRLQIVAAHRGVTRFRVRTRGRACHSSDPAQGVNAIYHMAQVVTCLQEYADHLAHTVQPHPLCGRATLSVGRIDGGISVNIVPDCCVIEVDRRVIPGEDRAAVTADVKRFIMQRVDGEVEFDPPWLDAAPLDDARNGWLVGALVDCISRLYGPRKAVGVPFCTHASQISAAGVPSVVFGPGAIEQAHTCDEYIDIEQLDRAAEAYFQFCANPPARPA